MARKNCSRCSRWLLICINFHIHSHHPNGKIKSKSFCAACKRKEDRERKYTPEQKQKKRVYQREWTNLKRREQGIPARKLSKSYSSRIKIMLPVDPISEWLKNQGEDLQFIAECANMDREFLRRIRDKQELNKNGEWKEKKNISIDTVEKILLSRNILLNEIYDE